MSLHPKSIGNVTIIVEDLDTATEFYRDRLGFKEVERIGDDPVTLELGDSYLELYAQEKTKEPRAHNLTYGSTNITIDSSLDINKIVERLGESEILLLKGPENYLVGAKEYQAVYFRDPDKNLVEIRSDNVVEMRRGDKQPEKSMTSELETA